MNTTDEQIKKSRLIVRQSREVIQHLEGNSIMCHVEESKRLLKESEAYLERARLLNQNPWWLPRKPE